MKTKNISIKKSVIILALLFVMAILTILLIPQTTHAFATAEAFEELSSSQNNTEEKAFIDNPDYTVS